MKMKKAYGGTSRLVPKAWSWRVVSGDLPATRRSIGVDEYKMLNPGWLGWHDLVLALSPDDQRKVHDVRRRFVRFVLDVAGQTCSPFCQFIDVGTDSPTSDIDVTVVNTRASLVVRLAAELFETLFLSDDGGRKTGKGPGATTMSRLMDVNVYSNIYYDACGGAMQPKHMCPSTPPELAVSQAEQAVWALLRVPEGVFGPSLSSAPPAWRSLCRAAAEMRSAVGRSCGAVSAQTFLSAIERSERLLAGLVEVEERTHDDEATIVDRRKDRAAWIEARAEYLRSVSIVRCLETDAYISYGAFAHVVLVMQAGKTGVRLTPLEYIASFFDNLGFLCGCERVDAHAAKYLVRCADAVHRHDDAQKRLSGSGSNNINSSRKSALPAQGSVSLARALVDARRMGATADVLSPMLARFSRSVDGVDELVRNLRPTIARFAAEVHDVLSHARAHAEGADGAERISASTRTSCSSKSRSSRGEVDGGLLIRADD